MGNYEKAIDLAKKKNIDYKEISDLIEKIMNKHKKQTPITKAHK